MKKVILFTVISELMLLHFSSCTRKMGCDDPLAENFDPSAQQNDGTCAYADEKFIGSFLVSENYTSQSCGSGTNNYLATISAGFGHIEVILSKLGELQNISFMVNGTTLASPYQSHINSPSGYWDLEGASGATTDHGQTIHIDYIMHDDIYNNNCGYLSGQAILTRQ